MHNVQKNRLDLINYLYTAPDRDFKRQRSMYLLEGPAHCLCMKGQIMKHFFGTIDYGEKNVVKVDRPDANSEGALPEKVRIDLDINFELWDRLEYYYEGSKEFADQPHTFTEVADWLQTLPGWPQIKPLTLKLESVSIVEVDQGVLTTH